LVAGSTMVLSAGQANPDLLDIKRTLRETDDP
jgi:hypothetical protein